MNTLSTYNLQTKGDFSHRERDDQFAQRHGGSNANLGDENASHVMGHDEHPADRSIPVAETPRGGAPTPRGGAPTRRGEALTPSGGEMSTGARSMEETPRGGGEDTELPRGGTEVGRQVKLPRDLLDAVAGMGGTAAGHTCLLLSLPVTLLYRLLLH
jgi:hypothetical protein